MYGELPYLVLALVYLYFAWESADHPIPYVVAAGAYVWLYWISWEAPKGLGGRR